MSRRILISNSDRADGSKAEVGSVVFGNKNTQELVIADTWSLEMFPKATWEPVGIVVIPGEHGVLKDGSGTKNLCGVMGIKPMSCATPEDGESEERNAIYWGGYNLDIEELADGLGRTDSVSDGLLDYTVSLYVPKQSSVGGIPSGSGPNPYKDSSSALSNERNPDYGISGPISDFRGIVNTKIITNLATTDSNWKIADQVGNSYGFGYYPAACCCARFKPTGTKAFVDCTDKELYEGRGFWYLPAAGELGYILPRLYDINNIIKNLNTAYEVGVQLLTTGIFWSSSENSRASAYVLRPGTSIVDRLAKNTNYRVRAFMRL